VLRRAIKALQPEVLGLAPTRADPCTTCTGTWHARIHTHTHTLTHTVGAKNTGLPLVMWHGSLVCVSRVVAGGSASVSVLVHLNVPRHQC
jgi:hypothetical protein